MSAPKSQIALEREEALKCVDILDVLVVSLGRIGSSWPELENLNDSQRLEILENFLKEWKLLPLLSEVRKVIASKFADYSLEDEETELERLLPLRTYWSITNQQPQPEFIRDHLEQPSA